MANVKISALPSLSTMTGVAIMPVVADGNTQQISGANLATYFADVTLGNLTIVDQTISGTNVNGNITIDPNGSGNVNIMANLVPIDGGNLSLGSPTSAWKETWVGPASIKILPEDPLTGDTVTLTNQDGYLGIDVGGFRIRNVDNLSEVFQVDEIGRVTIVSNISTTTNAALEVIGSLSGLQQDPGNPGVMIHATGLANVPARIYNDSYGTGVYSAYIGRHARGNAGAPTQLLTNDIISRIGGNPADSSNTFAPISTVRMDFVAAENQTPTARGSQIEFWTTPSGSNTIAKVATINGTDIKFLANGAGGITFADNTRQTTAYVAANNVTKLTAGAGITLSSNTGNITIGSTAVLGVIGTPNQISVANVGNVLTLSLPQNFGTNANVTLNELTVTNLNILGNISNIVPNVIDSTILYLGNTATSNTQIDGGGIILGNASQPWARTILYDLATDSWDINGGTAGLTTNNISANTASFDNYIHAGDAYNDYDFPTAVFQGDASIDSYAQIVLKNHYQGANSSSDIVAVANNGNDSVYYIDMGINSNVYANGDYAVTGPNDGYLYVNGGDLVIGTQTPSQVINFFTGGTDNVANIRVTISDSGLSATGNITGANVIGTVVSATGNVVGGNITTSGLVDATGNITGGNLLTGGIVSATGNITTASSINVSGTANVTGNVTGGNIRTVGSVSATGNITGNYFIGNGSLLTGMYGNANVAAYLPTYSGNLSVGNLSAVGTVVATANISGSYFIGNGSQLTGVITALGNAFTTVSANGVSLAADNTTDTVTFTPGNNLVITGNATTDTAVFAVSDSPSFTGNISAGNITTTGIVSATGNVTGNYFVGNGSLLTGAVTSVTGANNIVLSSSTGAITIQRIDGSQIVVTGNSAATYSVLTTDQYIGTTRSATGTGTVTLPLGSAVVVGRQFVVKDEGGNSGSSLRRITVAASGSDTIDGSSTRGITSNFGSLTVLWTGTRWSVI